MTTLSPLAHQYTAPAPLGTRAVLRRVEAGCLDLCAYCGHQIKFVHKAGPYKVVCNVYAGDRWDRVEHYHEDCYRDAGHPHGPTDTSGKEQRNTIRIKRP